MGNNQRGLVSGAGWGGEESMPGLPQWIDFGF